MRKFIAALLLCLSMPVFAQPMYLTRDWCSGDQWNSPADMALDATGTVRLSGLIFHCGDPGAPVAAILNGEFRPAKEEWFPIIVNGSQLGTAVTTPGQCVYTRELPYGLCQGFLFIFMKDDSAWASLSGITYKAAR